MAPDRTWMESAREILKALDEAESFTKGMDLIAFQNDPLTMRAVEMDLFIIGEAANAIPARVQEKHPQVPWHLVKGLRSQLERANYSVDPQTLWHAVQQDLPPISPLIKEILSDPPE